MNNKILRSGIIVCLFSLLFVALAIVFTNLNFPREISGKLVFAQSVEKGLELNKLVLKTPENIITFELDNNFWRVKEADYYYANIEFLNNLFININNSRYYGQLPYSPANILNAGLDDEAGVSIETYSDNKLLDSFIVGRIVQDGLYSFIKPTNKDEIWLAEEAFELPHDIASWLQQPLITYPNDFIEQVSVIDSTYFNTATRADKIYPFFDKDKNIVNPQALLERFNFLTFKKVVKASNFDEKSMPNHRKIILTTFSGLITKVDLFYDDVNYWIKISFSTTNLPTAAVNAYIKDNAFLYDGWYFQLPTSTGKVFSKFILR